MQTKRANKAGGRGGGQPPLINCRFAFRWRLFSIFHFFRSRKNDLFLWLLIDFVAASWDCPKGGGVATSISLSRVLELSSSALGCPTQDAYNSLLIFRRLSFSRPLLSTVSADFQNRSGPGQLHYATSNFVPTSFFAFCAHAEQRFCCLQSTVKVS